MSEHDGRECRLEDLRRWRDQLRALLKDVQRVTEGGGAAEPEYAGAEYAELEHRLIEVLGMVNYRLHRLEHGPER